MPPAAPPGGGKKRTRDDGPGTTAARMRRRCAAAMRADPRGHVRAVLGMYRGYDGDGGPLGHEGTAFVRGLGDGEIRRVAGTAQLIVPDYLGAAGTATARTHLALRTPVHMGGPSPGRIDEARMVRAVGYGERDAERARLRGLLRPGVRYGVSGVVLRRDATGGARTMGVVNVWGGRLEPGAVDLRFVGREFVDGGPTRTPAADRGARRYETIMEVTASLIEAALVDLARRLPGATPLLVGWNGVGLGVWLPKTVPRRERLVRWWKELGAHAARSVEAQTGNRVVVWVTEFSPAGSATTAIRGADGARQVVAAHADPLGVVRPQLAARAAPRWATDGFPVVVNAWDDWSYIGNGLAHDATVDGFVVAGGSPGFPPSQVVDGRTAAAPRTVGWQAVNSSFLLNPVFATQLVDPAAEPVVAATTRRFRPDKVAARQRHADACFGPRGLELGTAHELDELNETRRGHDDAGAAGAAKQRQAVRTTATGRVRHGAPKHGDGDGGAARKNRAMARAVAMAKARAMVRAKLAPMRDARGRLVWVVRSAPDGVEGGGEEGGGGGGGGEQHDEQRAPTGGAALEALRRRSGIGVASSSPVVVLPPAVPVRIRSPSAGGSSGSSTSVGDDDGAGRPAQQPPPPHQHRPAQQKQPQRPAAAAAAKPRSRATAAGGKERCLATADRAWVQSADTGEWVCVVAPRPAAAAAKPPNRPPVAKPAAKPAVDAADGGEPHVTRRACLARINDKGESTHVWKKVEGKWGCFPRERRERLSVKRKRGRADAVGAAAVASATTTTATTAPPPQPPPLVVREGTTAAKRPRFTPWW